MVHERLFDTGRVKLNYLDYGPPAGAPLVLLHGGAWRWQEYLSLIPHFAPRWHVYALDLRGNGRSGWVPNHYSLEDFTEDTGAFVRHVAAPAVLMGHSIGGVIALQTGPLLVERSLASAVGGVVGFAIAKELAPVMMSILIAGRIGSAMAAEIGSMRVYQEIDALRTMNINPIHYLVLPRLLAIVVALPLLVIFSILVAWLGGAFVCTANARIDIAFSAFFSALRDVVEIKKMHHSLIKKLRAER